MMFPSLRNILFVNKGGKEGILNEQSVKEMQSHPLSEMGKSTRSKLFETVVQDDDLFRLMKQQLRRSPQRALTNDGLAEVLHDPEFLKNLAEVVMEANRVKRERAAAESHAKSLIVEDDEEDESTDIECLQQQEGAGTGRRGILQSQRKAQSDRIGCNSRMMTSQQGPIYTVVEKRENAILPALRKASVVIQRGRQMMVEGTQASMRNLVTVTSYDDDNNGTSSQTLPSLIVSRQQQQHDGFTPVRRCQTASEGLFALHRSLPSRSNKKWNFDKPASKNAFSTTSSPAEEMDGAFAKTRKPRFNQGFLDLTSAEKAG
jgi:hypothetical protein